MTAAYDLSRARRLLVLVAAAARAAKQNKGVALARAVALTGARSEKQLRDDIDALDSLTSNPATGQAALELLVEDGEIYLVYMTLLDARPPALSLAEGAVLRAALERFEGSGGKAAAEALRKLRKAVPAPLRDDADALARGLDVSPPTGPWAGALEEAIEKRLETALDYAAVADGAVARRTVEPRALFHRDGRWYLAAWNVEKGAEHLYRLDRIEKVEVGTRAFGEHRGPPLARYERGKLFFESGTEREVTLRFRGLSARLARERKGGPVQENADGSVSVTARMTPGNYLYGLVLGHGGEATVEGPGDVADAVRGWTERLRDVYGRE